MSDSRSLGFLRKSMASCIPELSVLMLLAACGSNSAPSRSGFTTRDSAGVAILETEAPEWGSHPERGWTVDTVPSLQLGALEDSLFARVHPVAAAIRLEDGRVVVAGEHHTVLWYGERGEFLFDRGRRGEGPGEFTAIDRVIPVGVDSVAAIDPLRRRITVFDGGGRPMTVSYGAIDCSLLDLGRLPNGNWLGWCAIRPRSVGRPPAVGGPSVEIRVSESSPATGQRVRGLVSISPTGFDADTLALAFLPPPGTVAGLPVFGVVGDRIVLGEAREHALTILSPGGEVLRSIRWIGEDLAITPEDLGAWQESIANEVMGGARVSDPARLPEIRARVARHEYQRKGAYQGILVDPDQALWLHLVTYPDRPSVYRVIGPDGRWLGDVAMPANLEVTQIGRDFVLGIWKDPATDLEFVRMYRLRKP